MSEETTIEPNSVDKVPDSFGEQQLDAMEKVMAWHEDETDDSPFYLAGWAGTGKTTMAQELARQMGGSTLFCAFTGKASLVLRKKGCSGASTIHSAIYRRDEKIAGPDKWKLNKNGAASNADQIIVDEVSMVDEKVGGDLMSFEKKVLVLGDPFQLPPVKGGGYFTEGEPDVMLTEVHRFALDNPITQLSMTVRESGRLKPGTYGESLVVERDDLSNRDLADLILGADQLLVGTNKSRHRSNAWMRRAKGLEGREDPLFPAVGDRLVCTRNNHEKGTLNGGLWDVLEVMYAKKRKQLDIRVQSLDEPDMPPLWVTVPQQFFQGGVEKMDFKELRGLDQFEIGWVLTVHKAQGSAWGRVMVLDESGFMKSDADRWLYTAITRASESVVVVRP